jgi:hypothetical protein
MTWPSTSWAPAERRPSHGHHQFDPATVPRIAVDFWRIDLRGGFLTDRPSRWISGGFRTISTANPADALGNDWVLSFAVDFWRIPHDFHREPLFA